MAYTDITKPVIFNVTLQTTPKIDNFIRRMCIVSDGKTTLGQGSGKTVTVNDYKAILKDNTDDASGFVRSIISYFNYSNNKPLHIFEAAGDTDDTKTVDKQVSALDDYITAGTTKCYIYLVPSTWYVASSPFATMMGKYTKETSQQYFMLKMTNDDPSTDAVFTQFKDLKCLFCVYDNTSAEYQKTYSMTGSILGLIASAKFDITATNKASPLNFKTLNSYKFESIPNALLQHLIQAPVNFVFDEIGLPTIGNGRYTDGSTFEYWYQWDLTQIAINNKLTTMLINGANNPQYVIRYNQSGIDTLVASIKSVLSQQISLGCITNFAQSVDPVTGNLVGEGDVSAVEFTEYIKENPEDYQNEIYNGVSFYIMIGRYIRQVVINVTLN